MKANFSFIKFFKKNKNWKVEVVEKNSYYYEYSLYDDNNGSVFGVIELENEIINDDGITIGYFGINIDDKTIVYYLKEN